VLKANRNILNAREKMDVILKWELEPASPESTESLHLCQSGALPTNTAESMIVNVWLLEPVRISVPAPSVVIELRVSAKADLIEGHCGPYPKCPARTSFLACGVLPELVHPVQDLDVLALCLGVPTGI
jgi:hypothetical protein